MHDLEEIRARIDEVDAKMAKLFAERIALAREAAEVKRAHGLPADDPQREAEILERGAAIYEQKMGEESVPEAAEGARARTETRPTREANPVSREDYIRFQKAVLQISKDAQKR